jgi:hypothetical protein
MRLRLVVLAVSLCLFAPVLVHANEIYTLSVNYTGIGGLGPGSTLRWQFEVPSILTTPTTITSFLSASLGPGFIAEGCSISNAQLPLPGVNGFSSQVITDFVSLCGPGNIFSGAGSNFLTSITSNGVFDVISRQNGDVIGTLTISSVPEPPALSLLGTGILALASLLLFQGRYSRSHRKALTRAQS